MGTHPYEELGDEPFQELCQALLTRQFPDLQCYPVGMPDGGRDAAAQDSLKGSVVFQVKFCKDPARLRDPARWVCDAVDSETEKVERLAARGASRYILITNVKGTSHLDVGSMDRVQRYLDDRLSISAQCWWRNDIDRRLDDAYDLKLRYPAILSGPDLLRLAWQNVCHAEGGERRKSALDAYFGYHHKEESTVRFKQVELVSTELLGLYIDVPVALAQISRKKEPKGAESAQRAYLRAQFEWLDRQPGIRIYEDADPELSVEKYEGRFVRGRRPAIGCADLLTNAHFTKDLPFVVLEGAPGQGKSTLTQYLAQLQRARVLGRQQYVRRYPERHQHSPVALPFRIEMRDFATWMKGIDPWGPEALGGEPHGRARSLEGAIAAHIERYSGGIEFSVADLTMILKTTPCLLLLDALDEVASIDDRADVISAVRETLARFEGNRICPQVVVTSRPTAIAGSPSFPRDEFIHLSLAPIDRELALVYAQKWAIARRLDESDRRQLPLVLQTKIRAPHIAQLAKNTMQLSILLSLVQRRGSSLPDKRTELYNIYFDIFLDRESEKSAVVRDNRDLLFDIHRFLGFYMHAVAEQTKTSGRLGHERLKSLLLEYLTRESQPYDLIDSLLAGMVERFGALVSRVQGQYEFEVQPLQEYFAARHLNDTAPPSPPGRERAGTKPDRFDGISGNPYWFNVTRFFAGCFSKGELADLADRLCDLVSVPNDAGRPFARSLCVALLQDWVFSQSPRATRRLVHAVFDDIGLSWAATGYLDSARTVGIQPVSLPPGGGAEPLAEICWERIRDAETTEGNRLLCRLLSRNSSVSEIAGLWLSEFRKQTKERVPAWLTIGSWLRAASGLGRSQGLELVESAESSWKSCLSGFLLSGDQQWLDEFPLGVRKSIITDWLNHPDPDGPIPSSGSVLQMAAWLTEPFPWIETDSRSGSSIRVEYLNRHFHTLKPSDPSDSDLIVELCKRVGSCWKGDLARSLDPWIEVTSTLDDFFGRTWRSIEFGVMSGAMRNPAERVQGEARLLDRSIPWPTRIRYAKRFSKDPGWWLEQRAGATDSVDHGAWCAAAGAWAHTACLMRLTQALDDSMKSLSAADRQAVMAIVERAGLYAFAESRPPADLHAYENLASETLTLLSYRFRSGGGVPSLLLSRIRSPQTADVCLQWLVSKDAQSLPVDQLIESLKSAHRAGGSLYYREPKLTGPLARRSALAAAILDDPWGVPPKLVAAATSRRLRRKVSYRPVLDTADEEKWFA